MAEPTTKQALTTVGLGAGTLLVTAGVPIGLFVRRHESGAETSLTGAAGLLGFLGLFLGALLLLFSAPRFIAPGLPRYVRGELERSSVNLTTGAVNDGAWQTSQRAEWRPFVLIGLALWALGLVFTFFV